MKNLLKGWLVDNTVTGEDKTDKILTLESAGNLTLDDVMELMQKEETGLRKETIKHVVDLYQRKLAELVTNGNSINTGLFHLVPQFKGVIKDGVWDPKKNKIYVLLLQGKVLRDAIADTTVKILGNKGDTAYIAGSEDTATRATNGSATPGRNYRVRGKNIKVAGEHKDVGVYIIAAGGTKTKIDTDMIALNNPSDVIVLLPADLAEGVYELRIVTQFSNSARLLKEPHTISKQIYVGESPDDPNGEVEDPTA